MERQVLRIDFEEAKERFAGLNELFEKFLKRFPDGEEYSLLCRAMQTEDYEKAYFYAHTLKGVAGNLSLNLLWKSLEPLCASLCDPPDPVEAKRLFPPFEEEYLKTVQEIRAYFCIDQAKTLPKN